MDVFACVRARLCLLVLKGQKGQERRKASEKYLAGWERRLTVKANICLMLCATLFYPSIPHAQRERETHGTDSNNCEHLGSLQALHANPLGLFTWDRRPRAASIPTQEQPREQADYRSSPRRDAGTQILSDWFTLIIRTEWQWGRKYRYLSEMCHGNRLLCQKVNFSQLGHWKDGNLKTFIIGLWSLPGVTLHNMPKQMKRGKNPFFWQVCKNTICQWQGITSLSLLRTLLMSKMTMSRAK